MISVRVDLSCFKQPDNRLHASLCSLEPFLSVCLTVCAGGVTPWIKLYPSPSITLFLSSHSLCWAWVKLPPLPYHPLCHYIILMYTILSFSCLLLYIMVLSLLCPSDQNVYVTGAVHLYDVCSQFLILLINYIYSYLSPLIFHIGKDIFPSLLKKFNNWK